VPAPAGLAARLPLQQVPPTRAPHVSHQVHVERPAGTVVFVCSCGKARHTATAGSAPSWEWAFWRMARHLRAHDTTENAPDLRS